MTAVILTRGHRGNRPGQHVELPDGIAASMIAAGLARRPTPTTTTPPPPTVTHGDPQPPRHGAGSTREAWKTWAHAHGYHVPADATRNEIVTLVDADATRNPTVTLVDADDVGDGTEGGG